MFGPDKVDLVTRMWPTNRKTSATRSGPTVSASHIFPSGRSAVITALRQLGLQRTDTVTVSLFSGHCLLSSVARVATPSPEMGPTAAALVLYEQWGWPFALESIADIKDVAKRVPVVIDSVDTPYTTESVSLSSVSGLGRFRVWSLGKTLGGIGGGLLTGPDGGLVLAPRGDKEPRPISASLLQQVADVGIGPVNFFRDYSNLPPDDLVEMADGEVLNGALREEQAGRNKNGEIFLQKGFMKLWPHWMVDFIKDGGAPGIAPIGFGWQDSKLESIRGSILAKFGFETAVYHFNYSGNPVSPDFRLCLALPMHSQVPDGVLGEILDFVGEFV